MKVYISYSWKQPIKSIVKNWMCLCMNEEKLEYIIDEKECGYGEDIERFEHEIGEADNVLIVLSDSYFHSINCMFELALIIEHWMYNKRPIWLSIDDFNRSDATYDEICKYWKNQAEEMRKHLIMSGDMSKPYQDKLQKMELIIKNFPDAWIEIGKINTLDFGEVSAEHFRKLIACIQKRQLVDDETMREIEVGVPIEQGALPSFNIQQNGEKSVTQVVNSGIVNIQM